MKRPLNPIDEVFLSMGREPGLTHGQFLRFRGSPPPLAALGDHLVARLPGLPRLTYRTTTGSGRAYQVPSTGFDIRDHLREEAFPAGTTLDEVLTALVRLPLPSHDGPLWSLHLVHGYAPGEYAVCYRVHHGTEDGLGAVHVVASLFGDEPESGREAREGQGPLFGACPDELLRGTLNVGAGLVHGLLPARRWPRVPGPRPGHLAVCSTSATQRELGVLGQRFGGTFNDAFLMALWGALTTWSATEEEGAGVRSVFRASPVPVRMPLSTRRTGEEGALGNHLTTAVVALPDQGLRTEAAFAQLVEGTHRMRSRGLRPASRALVALLPSAVTRWTVRRLLSPRSSPLYASNYSLPNFLSFKGDPVIDAIPLGVLLPGNALSVTLLSCGSRVRVSFLYDRRLPEAGRLAALWRAALDTLSAPTAPAPGPPGASPPSTHTKGPSC
ncbi:wax ester/triacylglycerol synthase domain-containing protein [Streptomyces olivoreticuli]